MDADASANYSFQVSISFDLKTNNWETPEYKWPYSTTPSWIQVPRCLELIVDIFIKLHFNVGLGGKFVMRIIWSLFLYYIYIPIVPEK